MPGAFDAVLDRYDYATERKKWADRGTPLSADKSNRERVDLEANFWMMALYDVAEVYADSASSPFDSPDFSLRGNWDLMVHLVTQNDAETSQRWARSHSASLATLGTLHLVAYPGDDRPPTKIATAVRSARSEGERAVAALALQTLQEWKVHSRLIAAAALDVVLQGPGTAEDTERGRYSYSGWIERFGSAERYFLFSASDDSAATSLQPVVAEGLRSFPGVLHATPLDSVAYDGEPFIAQSDLVAFLLTVDSLGRVPLTPGSRQLLSTLAGTVRNEPVKAERLPFSHNLINWQARNPNSVLGQPN
jgi:hypothetical protein